MYNYDVKLLIDLFTQNEHITLEQSLKPIVIFLRAQMVLDGAWRMHNFAQLKSMPYILQNMLDKICKHFFKLSYNYFQTLRFKDLSITFKGQCKFSSILSN